jgi:hypothetical protein
MEADDGDDDEEEEDEDDDDDDDDGFDFLKGTNLDMVNQTGSARVPLAIFRIRPRSMFLKLGTCSQDCLM